MNVAISYIESMQLNALPEVSFGGELQGEDVMGLACDFFALEELEGFVQRVVVANLPFDNAQILTLKEAIISVLRDSVFFGPPCTGPPG